MSGEQEQDDERRQWEQALERVRARFERDGLLGPTEKKAFREIKVNGPQTKPSNPFSLLGPGTPLGDMLIWGDPEKAFKEACEKILKELGEEGPHN